MQTRRPRAPQRYETVKAADAVAALKASLKPVSTVKRDGKWQNMDAAFLVPGDMVLLGAGSSVPADCLVNHGERGRAAPVASKQSSAARP